jgi:hypothetical protein
MTAREQFDICKKNFLEIRKKLYEMGEEFAVVKAYKKPWKWYREHTIEEAIKILIQESK